MTRRESGAARLAHETRVVTSAPPGRSLDLAWVIIFGWGAASKTAGASHGRSSETARTYAWIGITV